VHRAENTNDIEALKRILAALGQLDLCVVMPLHPRTHAALEAASIRPPAAVRFIPPVSYLEMLVLEQHARLILTDSGGVQKEACWLHVPCVTLRNETEWEETVESGWNRLAGTHHARIIEAAREALSTPPWTCTESAQGDVAKKILGVLSDSKGEV
jgi:UDP-GlcNAc3NAcA epimerase